MDPADVTVATITLAREPEEEQLLRQALGALAGLGIRTVAADGGSPEPFGRYLSTLSRVHLVRPRGHGLVGQVAASFAGASEFDCGFLLYTEADKHLFFRDHLLDFIHAAPHHPDVGVVLAARSPAAFATFPKVQRQTESIINGLTGEVVGASGDYSYGPFLLRRSLAPYVDRAPADLGWGWRHFVFTLAHRLGHRIVLVEGDFRCPPGQDVEDSGERVHRLKQLAQNVQGLVLGLTMGTE